MEEASMQAKRILNALIIIREQKNNMVCVWEREREGYEKDEIEVEGMMSLFEGVDKHVKIHSDSEEVTFACMFINRL